MVTDSAGVQEETTYPRVPCLTLRPVTERPVTQQFHLDFDVSDIEADEKLVLSLGATVLERTDRIRPEANWRVYADPAGHPFRLCLH